MEVQFTPEQEAQLAQIATQAGTDAERLVKDAALRLLERGCPLSRRRTGGYRTGRPGRVHRRRRNGRPPGADVALINAHPLDARRRSGLAAHQRLPERTPSAIPAAYDAQALRGCPLPETVAAPWPCRGVKRHPRAAVSTPALYRGVPHKRAEHRDLANLPRCPSTAVVGLFATPQSPDS